MLIVDTFYLMPRQNTTLAQGGRPFGGLPKMIRFLCIESLMDESSALVEIAKATWVMSLRMDRPPLQYLLHCWKHDRNRILVVKVHHLGFLDIASMVLPCVLVATKPTPRTRNETG